MSETKRAFALKDRVAETFAGGSMAYGPEGETIDLAAMLEEGGGVIETSDPRIIAALDANDAFKGASKDDAEEASSEDGLDTHTREELLELAEGEDVDGVTTRQTKAELLTAIRAARASEEG